ncbi:MAG: hypothetical protein Q8L07_10445 [Sediminibacterium sp.]|nr:hypothetical protein [Sediminibacterium sp.]
MTEIDILKSIAENLSERKSTAALNNYEVLCNNIKYVNDLLNWGVNSLRIVQSQVDTAFKNYSLVLADFKDDTKPLFYFRNIVPRILLNDISVLEKFISYTEPDNRQGITVENVGKLQKSFTDYNNLVTSARQYIDSLVADAYQLTLLEAKSTNYQVLVSLNSFNKYATKSIRQGLFNTAIENSLTEFETLNYNQWANSHITRCAHPTFANKVDFLFSNLNLNTETDFKEEIKNLFKFSSEFTHIGYVSTFFTSSNASEVIFIDSISPYLPSTENFSELKYEILETATKFYSKIYLPTLLHSFKKSFEPNTYQIFETTLTNLQAKIVEDLKTRNNQYYFFIRQGLMASDNVIDLTCMCGTTNNWQPPNDLTKIYCKNCGSKFNLLEIEGDPGYIMTSSGPAKVIGSSVPDFNDLSPDKKMELMKQWEELMKKNKS